jgi:hypothetical protein
MRAFPTVAGGVDGVSTGVVLVGSDPVGRLGWGLTGLASASGGWRGGTAELAWRGQRPAWRASAAALDLPAGAQGDAARVGALRAGWQGASLGLVLPVAGDRVAHRTAFTIAGGRHRIDDTWNARGLAAASWNLGALLAPSLTAQVGVTAAAGRTGDDAWQRVTTRATIGWRAHTLALRAGWVDQSLGQERFVVGGQSAPLGDELVLGERLAAPLLPVGTIVGTRILGARVATPAGPLPGVFAFEAIGTAPRRDALVRTVAWEASLDTPRLSLVAFPALRLDWGVGVVLDAPLRRRVTGHLGVRVQP